MKTSLEQAPLSTRCQRSTASGALRSIALAAGAAAVGASGARAQITFSIEYRGPTIAMPNPYDGIPITAGDILTPATAGPGVAGFAVLGAPMPPGVLIHGGFGPPGLGIGTWGGCVGAPPGVPCPIELDALSYGVDSIPAPGTPTPMGTYIFSVDEFAGGIPGTPIPPAVWSEGGPPVFDAPADNFISLGMPGGPLPPGPPLGNTGLFDGNGMPSGTGAVYPGVGIVEPFPPFVGPGPAPGDNLDAIDVDFPGGAPGIFFSLNAGFFDPLRGIPNTGSAAANGFLPGAILLTPALGAAPVIYAPPPALGLDLFGPGTDDLDALALSENGIPGYQPGPGGDVVRFSVRRASAVIGVPDSVFGIPIEAGDILMPPMAAGMPPGIWIAAEVLGLATVRSGFGPFGDDLDALDIVNPTSPSPGRNYCTPGVVGVLGCPCGNPPAGIGRGCNNSAATGGAALTSTGTASLGADSVVFSSSGELATSLTILLQGTLSVPAGVVFGEGLRCVGGTLRRLYLGNAVGGVFTRPSAVDPVSVSARSAALGDVIAAGMTRYYMAYYRDPSLPCAGEPNFNGSQSQSVLWSP